MPPLTIRDYLAGSRTRAADVQVALKPAHTIVNSLTLLAKPDDNTGLGGWIASTDRAMSVEERQTHRLVVLGFFTVLLPMRDWPSFEEYLRHMEEMDPAEMLDKVVSTYSCRTKGGSINERPVSLEEFRKEALASRETYLTYIRDRFDDDEWHPDLEAVAYDYLIDPPRMKELIVTHIRKIWLEYMQPEWQRTAPLLNEAVRAFEQVDFASMTRLEAAEFITGRDLEPEKWQDLFTDGKQLIFVPNPHMGPYLSITSIGESTYVFFGPRPPKGVRVNAPGLSRNEILVRLDALNDDSRLQILRLIAEAGELRSQDVIQELGLSQSMASRHLKQLAATGFLVERRCEGSKCYRLNVNRLEDTLKAISLFLTRPGGSDT